MLNYTIRRFNLFVITLLILTMVGYSLLRLDPQSPWAIQDFWQGWLEYITELMQFNFGVNKNGVPIAHELVLVFPATLELCLIAFILSLLVGIPIGTVAGMKQGKWLDTIISFTSMSGYSAPLFWVAMMMIMVFSLHYEMLPVSGRYDLLYQVEHVTGFALIDAFLAEGAYRSYALQSVIEHMILPCLVLALAPTTQVIRLMRASVADIMGQNYIRAARIKGLSYYEIVIQHVLRNAIPPIIPKFGVQLSSMLTLAIITESIFNWPGIGRWLLDALSNQDYVSIQAGVIAVGALVLTANILSDLIGAMINPLVRKEWYANK
ncbi:ABC transporter permease subunit [Vibrio fluvialis]|jgi:cationic peptide transport system permease protein|uniref:Antimicrobial peptide ABC transporter permease SapB n=3 Tax=Vibrio TaxID=662 RepID=A0AAX2LMB4_VIBFL|nr:MULTISPECIES: ABC transporter permease subunit [Vibrio]HDM8032769.1 ABC transporter permease subunit [Vibrio fluvialis clinical-1]AMF94262.1 antimicrobial peptide ABC transporter permease SapB [Vibrio fluvialis]AVH32871.1 antimicrobial peptide ABC transporter permease SapB [Vibrio fluvialis]EKO3372381.1 ABC transporter permease subunit [Vibrio fluvialis]EKO3374938.1 ABC transporter permease subunit [Vibrio fluvialis]